MSAQYLLTCESVSSTTESTHTKDERNVVFGKVRFELDLSTTTLEYNHGSGFSVDVIF